MGGTTPRFKWTDLFNRNEPASLHLVVCCLSGIINTLRDQIPKNGKFGVLFWCKKGRHRSAGAAAAYLLYANAALSLPTVIDAMKRARHELDFDAPWNGRVLKDFLVAFKQYLQTRGTEPYIP